MPVPQAKPEDHLLDLIDKFQADLNKLRQLVIARMDQSTPEYQPQGFLTDPVTGKKIDYRKYAKKRPVKKSRRQ